MILRRISTVSVVLVVLVQVVMLSCSYHQKNLDNSNVLNECIESRSLRLILNELLFHEFVRLVRLVVRVVVEEDTVVVEEAQVVDTVADLLEVDMLHVVRVDLQVVDMMDVLVRVVKLGVLEDTKVDKVVEEDIEEMVEDTVADLLEVDMLHVVMTMVEDTANHVQLSIVVMLDTTHIHREENNIICECQSIYYNLGIYTGFPFLCQKDSSSNRSIKYFILQNSKHGSKKSRHFPCLSDIVSPLDSSCLVFLGY